MKKKIFRFQLLLLWIEFDEFVSIGWIMNNDYDDDDDENNQNNNRQHNETSIDLMKSDR